MRTFDGIILGSGHNSLVLQAYAGLAGLCTLCIESRDTLGGGLATIESPAGSGFLHNTHSFFHRGITRMPWYEDLDLESHGASYLQPELNVALVTRDGRSLEWWSDFEKTVASVARFNTRDAEKIRAWRDEFRPIVQKLLIPEAQSPPLPPEQRHDLLSGVAIGQRLLEVSRLSPLEFVEQEFQDPVVRAGLLFFNGLREVDLRLPGFGHHIPALLASDAMAQMCQGGARNLARALESVIRSNGGEFLTSACPQKILVEGSRVVGVLVDGEEYRASQFVVSGLNPQQTFLELFDRDLLPADWITKAEGFRYNLLAPLFALNLNLSCEPQYAAAQTHPHLRDAFMMILGLESSEQFHEIVDCHERGDIPPTVMWGACPTHFDAGQAPPGKHTAFMWEKLPYRVHGDPSNWDELAERHAVEMLSLWEQYAPNLGDSVLDSFARTPLDTERTLANMRGGDLLVGAFSHGQVGFHRPFPGAGHYRGHLPGLYLCGSSCHPGGNVTGLPGYNCAQVLFADLGIPTGQLSGSFEGRLSFDDHLKQL